MCHSCLACDHHAQGHSACSLYLRRAFVRLFQVSTLMLNALEQLKKSKQTGSF